jgi:hypothetical protein
MPIPKGAEGDRLAARVVIPLIAATGYGAFNLIYSGSGAGYFYTFVPLFGGIAAVIGFVVWYVMSSLPPKVSWKNLLVLFGFLPYLYFIYAILFLGIYMLYRGIEQGGSIALLAGGLFWTIFQYRGIYLFWQMTEMAARTRL